MGAPMLRCLRNGQIFVDSGEGVMKILAIVLTSTACLLLGGCSEPNRGQTATDSTKSHSAPARQPLTQPHSPDSLDKMAAVFVGSPSRALIKAQMDRALELYGLPTHEENYNRYGSVLVRMRQESGVREIEMLQFVIALREEVPDVDIKLPDAIALAATSLELSK